MRILFSLVFLFSFHFGHTQIEFNGGLKIGAITSQVSGDSYAGFNKIGFSAGPYLEVTGFSKEGLCFQMEILYSQKGSRNNPDTKNGDFSYFRLTMNYIEIPVLVKYCGDLFSYEAGLYYGYLMNSSQDNGSGPGEIFPAYRSADIGFQVGAGIEISEDKISLDARYSNSIIPIRESPAGTSFNGLGYDGRAYNSAIHVYLTYKL